jgi:MFS family permease
LGVSQSAGSLSRVLGPATAGFYFEEFGRNAVFFWGGVLVAAALFVALKLVRGLDAARLAEAKPARPSP